MNPIQQFKLEKEKNIKRQGKNKKLKNLSKKFIVDSIKSKYSYNFSWLGRPVIQYPQDIIAMQEIIWNIRPDLIIETGIAHGGGLIFYASMLELLGTGEVVGIDVDIREHNKKEIENHKMFKRIKMIEGSSVDSNVVEKVRDIAKKHNKVLVILDSLHTHKHVLKELNLYSEFVSGGSYLIAFDTVVENMPKGSFKNRPWDKGNNPATAVKEFLKNNENFVVDKEIENKLLITVAPGGYLKRIK
ncbi:MAG: cephalosporin hydroxylase family protein [Candidatus Staskawiczbacteria bacterium]|jgi:cephalosporin hydroxylase